MADDWQPGDLALCVKRGKWWFSGTGAINNATAMRAGQIHRVRRVGMSPNGWLTLWFDGFPGEKFMDGFGACRFRKIKPLTNKEREEALRDLKAPVREPAA